MIIEQIIGISESEKKDKLYFFFKFKKILKVFLIKKNEKYEFCIFKNE